MSNQNKPLDRSLLPDNSTPFEEAFEHATADMMASDNVYVWLNDPLTTKDGLLDLMAKEAGVQDWFSDDSETAKRQAINQAVPIHKKAGTRSGVRLALKAIGINATVIRGSKPYTIYVEGRLESEPLTSEISRRMNARVELYKSEKDTAEIVLTRAHEAQNYRGVVLNRSKIVRVLAGEPIPPVFQINKSRAQAMYSVKTVRVSHG